MHGRHARALQAVGAVAACCAPGAHCAAAQPLCAASRQNVLGTPGAHLVVLVEGGGPEAWDALLICVHSIRGSTLASCFRPAAVRLLGLLSS